MGPSLPLEARGQLRGVTPADAEADLLRSALLAFEN
jgi:hypothetical protein